MSKDLIVYFSLEGNTEYIAEQLRSKLGADVLKLVPTKTYHDKGFAKFFWGGKSAIMADKPALEPYSVDLASYDRIIFGSPVWASNFTPPLRTFIDANRSALTGKRISAYVCMAGSGGAKVLKKLAKFLAIPSFDHTAVFIDPHSKPDATQSAALDAFCAELQSEG